MRLILGDCLEVMKILDAGSVDAIVSDPPYGMAWDTNCGRFSGGSAHHRAASPGRSWGNPVEGDAKPFDPSPWLGFRKVILWGANHYAARLPVGTTLVWVKRHDAAFGSFLSDAEVAWMKGGHGVYLHKDLSMNANAAARVHPCQKPVGLMRWCLSRLKLKPGATVLDPYMGSGTTGIACVQMGLDFVGIERDPTYHAIAEKRIRQAQQDAGLFAATA